MVMPPENKKIMDYEANTATRKIKETIHSLSNDNHINGISYILPLFTSKSFIISQFTYKYIFTYD